MTREEAIERLEFHKQVWMMVGGIDLSKVLDTAIAALREQPVVHGRWVNEQMIVGGFAETWACDCSVCGRTQQEPLWKPNYCPNCGARMEEV